MKYLKKIFLLLGAFSLPISTLPAPLKAESISKTAASLPAAKKAPLVPAGFGPLKLGMTKEAVDALATEGDVFLTAALVQKNSEPGKTHQRYGSLLRSPLTKEPTEVVLTFELGVLTYLDILLEDDTLKGAEAQLSAKYGPPKVTEKSEEKQCLYKGGANFKLPSYRRDAIWAGQAVDGQLVKVSSLSVNEGVCPYNLRNGSASTFRYYNLSFSPIVPESSDPAKKNLF